MLLQLTLAQPVFPRLTRRHNWSDATLKFFPEVMRSFFQQNQKPDPEAYTNKETVWFNPTAMAIAISRWHAPGWALTTSFTPVCPGLPRVPGTGGASPWGSRRGQSLFDELPRTRSGTPPHSCASVFFPVASYEFTTPSHEIIIIILSHTHSVTKGRLRAEAQRVLLFKHASAKAVFVAGTCTPNHSTTCSCVLESNAKQYIFICCRHLTDLDPPPRA
jgi:hypothetical protein